MALPHEDDGYLTGRPTRTPTIRLLLTACVACGWPWTLGVTIQSLPSRSIECLPHGLLTVRTSTRPWGNLQRQDQLDFNRLRRFIEHEFCDAGANERIEEAYYFGADPEPPTARQNAFHMALQHPPPSGPGPGDSDFYEPIQHLVENENVTLILIESPKSISTELQPYAQAIVMINDIADQISRTRPPHLKR